MTKLLLLLLGWPLLAPGQTPDTLRAHYHYRQADSLKHAYYHDSAFAHFQRAAGGYYLAGAWGRYVRCLNRQAYCQYKVGRYGASLALAQHALRFSTDSLGAYHVETADAYAGVGDGYEGKEQYDSAMQYYQQALTMQKSIYGEVHPEVVYSLVNIAQVMYGKGDYAQAKVCHKQAANILNKKESIKCRSVLLHDIGNVYYYEGQYDSARIYYQKSQAISKHIYGQDHPALATDRISVGLTYLYTNRYDHALSIFQKEALRYKEIDSCHSELIRVCFSIGETYLKKGNYQQALAYYQKALRICNSITKHHSTKKHIYSWIGEVYYELGAYDLSLDYFERALSAFYGSHSYHFQAYVYQRMAYNWIERSAFDTATYYAHKALEIERTVYEEYSPHLLSSYYCLGYLYSALGNAGEALTFYRKALEASDKYNVNRAFVLQGVGNVYMTLEEYEKAKGSYRKAAFIIKSIHSQGTDMAEAYNKYAEAHKNLQGYDSALYYYQKSIAANTSVSNYVLLLSRDTYHSAPQLLTALHGQASTLQARYQQTDNLADRQAAQRCYRAGDSLVAQMRQTYLKHSDRIAFSKTTRQMYHDATGSSLARPQSGDTEAAFYFAERSKAGALTLALADRRAKHFAGVPDTLLAQERQLQQERTFYRRQEQEAQQQEDRVRQQHAEDRRFMLDRCYDSLVQTMERRFPRYHTLKYGTRVRSLSDVRVRLDSRTALLEYVLDDTVGYVFGVSQRRDTVLQFVVDSRLHRQLQTLRTTFTPDSLSVADRAASNFASVAYRVYRRLLAPVLATLPPSVDRLVVVPDGALSYLPFDMLLTEPVRHRRYRQWPYLLRHYALSYAYSATLQWPDARPVPQQSPVEADDSSGSPRLLALAPAYEGVQQDSAAQRTLGEWRDAVVPLAWNQHEVTNLRRYLPGTFVAGDAAQEATFKDQTDGHTVVHLAAHALLDEEDPMQSRLVFSAPTDSTEDGFLHAYELYGMDVPARLAVLSACHTGSGRLAEGEGLMSLARAFAYAGCPSVVMNRWAAHDVTTSRVMDRLYYYLAEGYDKADALRQAKLDFLAQARGAAQFPAYWGGWMLVGDRTPLMSPSRGPGWVVSLLILVGGGVGWWVWAQRRKVMR